MLVCIECRFTTFYQLISLSSLPISISGLQEDQVFFLFFWFSGQSFLRRSISLSSNLFWRTFHPHVILLRLVKRTSQLGLFSSSVKLVGLIPGKLKEDASGKFIF